MPPQLNGRIRPELHLGRFFFQKLVMYRDLQRHEQSVFDHPMLRLLGGERVDLAQPKGLPQARDLDTIPPHNILEVLPADSSQQEAILVAKRGASFVLQGPPGTGKSQTIANMIAELLGMGKRVLFVSEKMAALQVVRKRLTDVGLAEYCLDLHDARADKKAFIGDLKASVQSGASGPRDNEHIWQRDSDALLRTRQQLNEFVQALHTPHLALNESAYHIYGLLAQRAETPDLAFVLDDVAGVTHERLETMLTAIAGLEQQAETLDQYATHPWRAIMVRTHTLQLASDIRAHFGRLAQGVQALNEALIEASALLGQGGGAIDGSHAADIMALGDLALTTPLPPRHWLDRSALPKIRRHARDCTDRAAAHDAHLGRLRPTYRPSFVQIDPHRS